MFPINAQQFNSQVPVPVRNQRLCGNPSCRQPGHTIRTCNHSSVAELRALAVNVSNYSIAYQYPEFIKRWVSTRLHTTSISILFAKVVNSSIITRVTLGEMKEAIIHHYYQRILSIPLADGTINESRIRELASISFTPMIISGLRDLMESLGVQYRVLPGERLIRDHNIARNNLAFYSTRLATSSRRMDALIAEHAETELLREAALQVYIRMEDEMEEYNRTHTNGVLNQRKFPDMAVIIKPVQDPNPEEVVAAEEFGDCPICMEPLDEAMVEINCGHKYCDLCITRYLDTLRRNQDPTCSMCRTGINCMMFRNESSRKIVDDKYCAVVAV